MREYIQIVVPMSKEEFEALQNSAQQDYRQPKEQARFLLRSLLLRDQFATANSDTHIRQDSRIAIPA